ncbi:MAG: hypothetical protein Q4D13_07995 [Erysipelotrichaceae bacterium]|nr:hypothetical protein [Erysipelotrichaceae bacterium]
MNKDVMITMALILTVLIVIIMIFKFFIYPVFRNNKRYKTCHEETTGVITDIRMGGSDYPDVITVKYDVDGKDYIIKENVRTESEALKLGKIPAGQRIHDIMGPTDKGTLVTVMYNIDNPSEAYILENKR